MISLSSRTVRPSNGWTTHEPPPDNQVPGPASCSKGPKTLDLPGKGHSTHQFRVTRLWVRQPGTRSRHPARVSDNPPVAGTGSLDFGSDNPGASRHGTPAMVGPPRGRHSARVSVRVIQEARSAEQGSDNPGHTRPGKGHSTHQLPGQGQITRALPVHGPTDRACQYFRRHRVSE